MAAAKPETEGEPAQLQYSLLLEHLVGEKRRPRQAMACDPAALGGFPAPAKSPEQKMVERAMESCGFKAALACVGGMAWGRVVVVVALFLPLSVLASDRYLPWLHPPICPSLPLLNPYVYYW